MKNYKTIIFDFDGTIVDSLQLITSIYNQLAGKYGFSKLNKHDILHLRSLGPKEALAYLGIPYLKLPMYLLEGRSLYKKYLRSLYPIKGMPDVIRVLSRHFKLAILTSNEKAIVQSFLDEQALREFEYIVSERNIFGKDKPLSKLLNKYQLDREDVLYVADEVRDIHSCQKIGIDIASVTWGFNNEHALEKHSPRYIANTPKDLLKILEVV